jgi:hypothetical protein
MIDSSRREYEEPGTVEQVEPGSAVMGEGGLVVAWRCEPPAISFLSGTTDVLQRGKSVLSRSLYT